MKSEIIATCSRLSAAYSQTLLYDIQYKSMYRLYDLNNKIEFKTLGDTFLSRNIDSVMEMSNYKTNLLQNLVELYNHLPKDDINFLKSKYSTLQDLTYIESSFDDIKEEDKVRERRAAFLNGFKQSIKTTDVYLISEEIKKRLSPHI